MIGDAWEASASLRSWLVSEAATLRAVPDRVCPRTGATGRQHRNAARQENEGTVEWLASCS